MSISVIDTSFVGKYSTRGELRMLSAGVIRITEVIAINAFHTHELPCSPQFSIIIKDVINKLLDQVANVAIDRSKGSQYENVLALPKLFAMVSQLPESYLHCLLPVHCPSIGLLVTLGIEKIITTILATMCQELSSAVIQEETYQIVESWIIGVIKGTLSFALGVAYSSETNMTIECISNVASQMQISNDKEGETFGYIMGALQRHIHTYASRPSAVAFNTVVTSIRRDIQNDIRSLQRGIDFSSYGYLYQSVFNSEEAVKQSLFANKLSRSSPPISSHIDNIDKKNINTAMQQGTWNMGQGMNGWGNQMPMNGWGGQQWQGQMPMNGWGNQMPMNPMGMGMNPMGMGMNPMGMNQMGMGMNQWGMNPMGMNQMGMNPMGMNQWGMNGWNPQNQMKNMWGQPVNGPWYPGWGNQMMGAAR